MPIQKITDFRDWQETIFLCIGSLIVSLITPHTVEFYDGNVPPRPQNIPKIAHIFGKVDSLPQINVI